MTPEEHKAYAIEQVNKAAEAVNAYNLTDGNVAGKLTGLDFIPGTDAPATEDPIIEIREDGAALLREYVKTIDQYAQSEDPLMVEWATGKFPLAAWQKEDPYFAKNFPDGIPHAKPWGMLPEVALRPGLTERQRSNILQSCGRANFMVGPRPTGESDRDYAGRSFYAFDYKNGQPYRAIMDCHAYQAAQPTATPPFPGAVLSDVPRYAKLHFVEWKKARPRGTAPIIGDNKPK